MEYQRCKSLIKEGETYDLNDKNLYEYCYMYETNPPKASDPMAVASALCVRKQIGQTGSSGLSEMQQKICDTIEKYGRITKDEL